MLPSSPSLSPSISLYRSQLMRSKLDKQKLIARAFSSSSLPLPPVLVRCEDKLSHLQFLSRSFLVFIVARTRTKARAADACMPLMFRIEASKKEMQFIEKWNGKIEEERRMRREYKAFSSDSIIPIYSPLHFVPFAFIPLRMGTLNGIYFFLTSVCRRNYSLI